MLLPFIMWDSPREGVVICGPVTAGGEGVVICGPIIALLKMLLQIFLLLFISGKCMHYLPCHWHQSCYWKRQLKKGLCWRIIGGHSIVHDCREAQGSQMALLGLLTEECFSGSGARRPFCALRGRVWFPAPRSGGSHTVYIRPCAWRLSGILDNWKSPVSLFPHVEHLIHIFADE